MDTLLVVMSEHLTVYRNIGGNGQHAAIDTY